MYSKNMVYPATDGILWDSDESKYNLWINKPTLFGRRFYSIFNGNTL